MFQGLGATIRSNNGLPVRQHIEPLTSELMAGSAFQAMMSSSPSAPASPSFSHAPLVNVPGPSRKVIAGPANMPDVERVGSSDEEGLGKGVGRGWLGDLDG